MIDQGSRRLNQEERRCTKLMEDNASERGEGL